MREQILRIKKKLVDNLDKLLILEKKRRNITKDKLLFVGMANIADYRWCGMRSVLKSREDELDFFGAYLMDRIRYSIKLDYCEELPKKIENWLETGNKVTFRDVEKLLKEIGEKTKDVDVWTVAITKIDKGGNKVMIINPNLSFLQRKHFEERAKSEGIRVADAEEFPKIRGRLLETIRGERYPTIRWNFQWHNYVIVGVPDGINKKFVYEYKTTRNKFLSFFVKPVALTQADLYGYFFKRNYKRVQIYTVENGKTNTWDKPVNKENAINTLVDFEKVDNGNLPKLPKKWKCKNCKFFKVCPLVNSGKSGSNGKIPLHK